MRSGNDLGTLAPKIQQDHRERIEQKNQAMDGYEQFIKGYLHHCEIDPSGAMKWPSLIDRLTSLGRRIEYRTVYAAMCSQAHHDAEDVLNYYFANHIEGVDHLAETVEREADTFSIFMVLFGLQWFVEAILAACDYLKFPTVVAESKISLKRVVDELQLIASHRDTGEIPENWVSYSLPAPDEKS